MAISFGIYRQLLVNLIPTGELVGAAVVFYVT